MKNRIKKRVLYGVANYQEIVLENGYFVDKTHYIEKLELSKNQVFLRPRRFGKSLFCQMLECYYDVNQLDDFERLSYASGVIAGGANQRSWTLGGPLSQP